MASRGSIITGAKSIPGSSRPTPANQGLNPYVGQVSPMAAQLDSGGHGGSWTNAYRNYLPRTPQDFTDGAFGPFSPILPVPVDAPEEGSDFADPRRFQYEVGWNLPTGQPGAEGTKLCDFGTLKTLADLYSVARAAIQLRKNEICGLEWEIMPSKDAAKTMRGDRDAMRDFGERRAEATRFFRRPDPDYFSWNTWLSALLEEVFVFDALALLFRKKWAKGQGKGLLGSDLDSLELISGPTIRPLLDMHGAKPRPPAPAYQQYLYGVPRTDLMTLVTGRDIEEGGLSGSEYNAYRADQLLYLPMVPRRETVYGFPPIERALVPVMTGLQKQGYQLDYYREGTVPAVYVSPGGVNANMTPNQIRELQDALNAIAGDPAWHHKIIVLPADSKVLPQREQQLADQLDEIVMNQVCMAFDVQPMELGISPKVSTTTSPGASNQMAKASQGIHDRKATRPTLTFLSDIMNAVLQDVAGQPDMRFVFEGLEEQEDEATKTTMLVSQIGAGLRSMDEGREELNLQPWGLPETSDPGWATPAGGWIPLAEAAQARATDLATGPVLELPPGVTPAQQQSAAPAAGAPATAPAGAAKPAGGGGTGNAGQSPGHESSEGASASAPASDRATKAAHPGAVRHQARREARISSAVQNVTDRLTGVVQGFADGHQAMPQALDEAVAVLGAGYRQVMTKAAADARTDHGFGTATKDDGDDQDDGAGQDTDPAVDSDAATRAEGQRGYLMGLLAAVTAAGVALGSLAGRLGLYGRSLNGAYNAAYGNTVRAEGGADYQIVWHLGASEHCALCVARDGQVFTFHSLPGFPGDGGFGGPGAVCLGGANCRCSLEYLQGSDAAVFDNTQREDAMGYYQQQLADITARRDDAEQARADFLDTVPEAASARAHTRDSIRQEVADRANQRIRNGGGYPGVSVEPGDVDAATVAARTPAHMKARAVDSELEALARHMRKGRLISTWEPRHIDQGLLARVAELMAKGLDGDTAIAAAKAMRRVADNGQEYWDETAEPMGWAGSAGGGGPEMTAHDADGIPVSDGQATVKGATAAKVRQYLLQQYPHRVLEWVDDAHWSGPSDVPLDRIDMARRPGGARNEANVDRMVAEIKAGRPPEHPVVLVDTPGGGPLEIADGWHRTLAFKKAGAASIRAWIGAVDTDTGPWGEQMNEAKLPPPTGGAP